MTYKQILKALRREIAHKRAVRRSYNRSAPWIMYQRAAIQEYIDCIQSYIEYIDWKEMDKDDILHTLKREQRIFRREKAQANRPTQKAENAMNIHALRVMISIVSKMKE